MPWTVIKKKDLKRPGKPYAIVRADTGKVVGRSATKAKAQASVRIREQAVKGHESF